jgi:hypothetical protein
MHTEFVHLSHKDLERPIATSPRERDHVTVGRNRDRVRYRRRDPDVRGKAEDEAQGRALGGAWAAAEGPASDARGGDG